MTAKVLAVCRNPHHTFSKRVDMFIRLREGLGVEGDAHMGATVKHRSRVAKDPGSPNLRQVHLIHAELFDELAGKGFSIHPGDMGENITTSGIDLLGLPEGARLHIGGQAIVEVTGLRNPCGQIDKFRSGLTQAVLDRDEHGNLVRKSGIMAVVLADGQVAAGDQITITFPEGAPRPLRPV